MRLHENFGLNLARHRADSGMSIREYGDAYSIAPSTISALENSRHGTVTLRTVADIAASLELCPLEMLEEPSRD